MAVGLFSVSVRNGKRGGGEESCPTEKPVTQVRDELYFAMHLSYFVPLPYSHLALIIFLISPEYSANEIRTMSFLFFGSLTLERLEKPFGSFYAELKK